jgi:hypothetical protein
MFEVVELEGLIEDEVGAIRHGKAYVLAPADAVLELMRSIVQEN